MPTGSLTRTFRQYVNTSSGTPFNCYLYGLTADVTGIRAYGATDDVATAYQHIVVGLTDGTDCVTFTAPTSTAALITEIGGCEFNINVRFNTGYTPPAGTTYIFYSGPGGSGSVLQNSTSRVYNAGYNAGTTSQSFRVVFPTTGFCTPPPLQTPVNYDVDNSDVNCGGFRRAVDSGSPDFAKDEFSLFPNPTGGNAKLVIPSDIKAGTVLITDLSGRTIQEYTFSEQVELELSISNLPKGIYPVKISHESGSFNTKLVKE